MAINVSSLPALYLCRQRNQRLVCSGATSLVNNMLNVLKHDVVMFLNESGRYDGLLENYSFEGKQQDTFTDERTKVL